MNPTRENRYSVFVVDDESANLESLERILRSDGAQVSVFCDPSEALLALRRTRVDLLITDLRMHSLSGIDLLVAARSIDPSLEVIVVTAYGTVEIAVEAMKKGAYDFITKPLQRLSVLRAVEKALERRKLVTENHSLKEELMTSAFGSQAFTGRSQALREMLVIANQAAHSFANVLIEGESGTGKGLLAQYLHGQGESHRGLLVKINCTAIPENLLEAELFGYERGAFTGAVKTKKGRIELSEGGTLFLDEVGIAPPAFQAKLLRFLQEGEFERLGSNQTLRVQTRVVSATNTDLKLAISKGFFREDLYYRLNVVHIRVPALRERAEDIALLATKFVEDAARKNGRESLLIHPAAMENLVRYSWPGNVRELQNIVERAVVLCRTGMIHREDLPTEIAMIKRPKSFTVPIGTSLKQVERMLMDETLRSLEGDRKLAAKLLGVHPRTLYRHLGEDTLAIESCPIPPEETL